MTEYRAEADHTDPDEKRILFDRHLGEYGHFVMPLAVLLEEAAWFLGLDNTILDYERETKYISRASQGVHPEEAAVLYALTRLLKPRLVLETGTFEGYSTAEIARALHKNGTGHIESIDISAETGGRVPENLRTYVTFRQNMASLELTRFLAEQSASINLFFHDSAHNYINALDELVAFAPFFAPGCVIVCHDAKMDFMPDFGVGRAVREFAQTLKLECAILDTTCGLALLRWPPHTDKIKLEAELDILKKSLDKAKTDRLLVNRVRRVWRVLKGG